MSNLSNIDISHYKVLALPAQPEPNSVYYVLDQSNNIVKGYIIDKQGVAMPLFTSGGGGGESGLQPGDNVSELVNDGDGTSPYVTQNELSTFDEGLLHTTGDEIKDGNLTLNDTLYLPDLSALPGEFINLGVDEFGAVINIPIETSTAGDIKIAVTNKTGVSIPKGSAVYINGAQGSKATIALALADPNIVTSASIGITSQSISNNATGYVVIIGEIFNIDTSLFANGDKVYLSPTIPGGLTTTVPTSPNNVVFIGTVTNAHSTQGKIIINVIYTTKLDRLIDVAIANPTEGETLTYEVSSGLWKNKATTADVEYTNLTPTITALGGIPVGATFNNKTMTEMWNALLYPELFPALVNPSNTFTANTSGVFETGSTIPSITFSATFNRGSINPAYGTDGFRSGLPTNYVYTGAAVTSNVSTALTNSEIITNHVVVSGANTWTGAVSYSAGQQPLSSSGNPFSTALPAGTTGAISASLTGVHPVFYGKSLTPPVANQALINGGSKSIVVSTGTVTLTFGATTEYIWFAIPQSSTDKTKWFVDALNQGSIGTSTDLFNNDIPVSISSPTSLWSGISYRIYISNYATTTTGSMQLQN